MKISIYYVFVLAAIMQACQSNPATEGNEKPENTSYCLNPELKKSTTLLPVKEQALVEQISLPGKIEYNENDLVVFRTLLSGVVETVNFELGDQVRKGQVLARIKSTEIQALDQQRRLQESELVLLQKQLDTKKDLLNDGMASKTEVLELEHQLASAKLELDRINQSLGLYRATSDGAFQILAPKDGFIIQKNLSPGLVISPDSEPLFSVSNLKQVWVMVNVFASNLRYIQQGDEVKVKSLAYPDQTYIGRIDRIFNVFDDNEHVMKARVVLDNQNLKLLPGLSADIIIEKKQAGKSALAIPNNALIFNNNKNYVLEYHSDCDIKIKMVEPIYRNQDFTYVSDQLGDSIRVVGTNALLIFEELNAR